MKKWAKIVVGITTGLLLIGTLTACGPDRTPEEKADYIVEKMSSKLDLSEPQIMDLELLKTELLDTRQQLKVQHKQVHQEMEEIFSQSTLDQQRILTILREQTEIINNQAPGIIASIANFYDDLTPEQQSELHEKIRQRRDNKYH